LSISSLARKHDFEDQESWKERREEMEIEGLV
jgi:hypothetical protein